jgi:hypothetical protein
VNIVHQEDLSLDQGRFPEAREAYEASGAIAARTQPMPKAARPGMGQ